MSLAISWTFVPDCVFVIIGRSPQVEAARVNEACAGGQSRAAGYDFPNGRPKLAACQSTTLGTQFGSSSHWGCPPLAWQARAPRLPRHRPPIGLPTIGRLPAIDTHRSLRSPPRTLG